MIVEGNLGILERTFEFNGRGDRVTPSGTVRLNDGLAVFVIGLLFPEAGSFHDAIGKTPLCKANLPNYGKV